MAKSQAVAAQYFFSIQEKIFRIEKMLCKLLILFEQKYVFYKT